MINLTTFFQSLGIIGGNTQATNFYEFWYGIEFSGGTITYNITEFMTYLGTNRYEFFHSLESTYPEVFDEYTFYKNIDDVRIYDFFTFYTYAGEYLGGSPTPTFQSWDVYDSGGMLDASCTSLPNTTYYSTGSTIQIGDIIYTDSSLTTAVVGGGSGYDYVFIYPLEPIQAPLFICNIDTDGSIMSFSISCFGNYQFASGNTSNDACSSSSYDFTLNTSASVGSQVWVITPDNITPTKFELFEGNNLFYQFDEGFGAGFIQVSNDGEVIDNGSCPTPTPTPTNTATPTPTPTNTPTPTPSSTPTISVNYISSGSSSTSSSSYTFSNQNYGGTGYIVIGISQRYSTISAVSSVSLGGTAATSLGGGVTGNVGVSFWGVRKTGGTSGDVVINCSGTQLGLGISVYRIQNNITDARNQFKLNTSITDTTLSVSFDNQVQSGDVVLAISNIDKNASETWTKPNENVSISYASAGATASTASEKQTITDSYTATVEWSSAPTLRGLLYAITIR